MPIALATLPQAKPNNAHSCPFHIRVHGFFPRQDQTGLCMHEPCFTTARSYSPKTLPSQTCAREGGRKSLVPMVPASFLPLFLLDSFHSVRQRNLLRCLLIAHHRVHELVPGPEPLTSHHSSARTSLAYRWASPSTVIGRCSTVQSPIALNVTDCGLLQKSETFINSPIP